LGGEFLHRFTLTIDYPRGKLFLEPNDHYDDAPQPYDGSGAAIQGKPGDFVVGRVLAESPAAKAGLRSGDVLVSLDGVASSDLTIYAIRAKLYRAEGKCILTVKRGGGKRTVVIQLKSAL
jgi:C-terminal processing protease CtpA/Prc